MLRLPSVCWAARGYLPRCGGSRLRGTKVPNNCAGCLHAVAKPGLPRVPTTHSGVASPAAVLQRSLHNGPAADCVSPRGTAAWPPNGEANFRGRPTPGRARRSSRTHPPRAGTCQSTRSTQTARRRSCQGDPGSAVQTVQALFSCRWCSAIENASRLFEHVRQPFGMRSYSCSYHLPATFRTSFST
jgi:hypothetical protein